MTIPLAIRNRGQEVKLILGSAEVAKSDAALIALVENAGIWASILLNREAPPVRALARDLGKDHRLVARTLPLAFLTRTSERRSWRARDLPG